jgi:hypothetical protein
MQQVLASLDEIREWCLSARVRDEKEFCVAGTMSQDQASAFAFAINQERCDGHAWIGIVDSTLPPDPTTKIHVRYSH